LVDAQETVWSHGRLHGIDGNLQAAIGAILETDGHGQSAGHLTMGLRLGGAGADGGPAHQVGEILRHHRIQKLGAGRKAHLCDLQQELPRFAQTGLDVIAAVQVRVVDQTFPADGGAWFLEINAHDHIKLVRQFLAERVQTTGVIQGSLWIVNRTRANHDQQTRIRLLEDLADRVAAGYHRPIGRLGHRQIDL
jgi:hypothetical protein